MRKLLIISLLFLAGCLPVEREPPSEIIRPDPKGVVSIYAGGAWGTGFAIKKVGVKTYWVVTCQHVIKAGLAIGVNGQMAEVVAENKIRDIAILKFDSDEELPVYKFGKPIAGDYALIIGKPPIMTQYGPLKQPVQHEGIISWVQGGQVGVDAGVVSGMSGAPIFNSKGEVVAMVRAHFSQAFGKSEVLGTGIHISEIKKIIPD